jgi:hypothetical protein
MRVTVGLRTFRDRLLEATLSSSTTAFQKASLLVLLQEQQQEKAHRKLNTGLIDNTAVILGSSRRQTCLHVLFVRAG